jgi:serine/threonine protein kinase
VARTPAHPPQLDGYRFLQPIGAGGFSDVFLYEQLLPNRTVAVKVLLSTVGAAGIASFTSEANLMARLSTHPFIVTIHTAGVAADGRPYLVMEYCSRPNLAQRYKTGPLPVDDALRTGVRIASAVETAHRAGILHRDIKPGNVLTNDYGYPALTDFGIAGAADSLLGGQGAGGSGDTGTESVGLSVPWSPPEMFLDVPQHDARSDVFSLAATIYTVLAVRTPFEVPGGPNSAVDLMARIERGQLTPMERDDVPRSLLAALATGMAPRREDRFSSALEFGRALQRVELESGLAATTLEIADTAHAENLVVESPDAAETRVRSLPTVVPDAPAPPPEPGPVTSAPPPRDRASSVARLAGILVGVFSLLVVAAVVLAVVLTGGPIERPDAGPAPSATGGSAVGQGAVAPAVDGTATRSPDGTAVTFAWTNPDPHEGDLYYWALSETPDSRQVVETPEVTVEGVAAAARVCVNVEIGRAGRTSEPVRICTP